MRIRKLVAMCVCALTIGALLPATASAAFSNYRSTSADAWWSSWNWDNGEPSAADPMEDRFISGWSSSSVWKDGKTSTEITKGIGGAVWISSYTPATDTEHATWTEFSLWSSDATFLMGKKLSSASLDFIAPGEVRIWHGTAPWVEAGEDSYIRDPDEVVDAGMVSVVASWKPTGPLSRWNMINRERSADFSFADRYTQNYRVATADVSVVGADGTVYWFDAVAGSINDGKGVSRYPSGEW